VQIPTPPLLYVRLHHFGVYYCGGDFMKTIEITCANCGKKTQKRKAEIDRRKREGRTKFYCGLSCVGKTYNNHLKSYKYLNKDGRGRDELSDFRPYANHLKNTIAKRKKKRKHVDITVEELKEVWDNQNGICPLTGWELIPRRDGRTKSPRNASIDRIDNDKGYVKDNIRFVSVMANYARNTFADEDVIEFGKAVAEHNG